MEGSAALVWRVYLAMVYCNFDIEGATAVDQVKEQLSQVTMTSSIGKNKQKLEKTLSHPLKF